MAQALLSVSNLTITLNHQLILDHISYATNVICLNKETVCSDPPKEVLNNEDLMKLFGEEVGFYQHH